MTKLTRITAWMKEWEAETVSDLLADTRGYTILSAGQFIETRKEGFRYEVAASDATDEHMTTAGGVKLYLISSPATPQALGAIPGTDCTDALLTLTAIDVHHIHFPYDTRGDYLTTKTIDFGVQRLITFDGGRYIKATSIDAGAVVTIGADCFMENPHIDGGGTSIITGSSGNNGVGVHSGAGSTNIAGGHIANCARGSSSPYDGGKGVQVENNGGEVSVHGTRFENCHIACSSRRDDAGGQPQRVTFSNIDAQNVNHLLYVGMANIAITNLAAHAVSFTNFTAQTVGAYDAGPDPEAGLFVFDRATQVAISNGSVQAATKLGGVWRGRGSNVTIDNVNYEGDLIGIVNIDPIADLAPDTSLSVDNKISVNFTGTADYGFYSDITDATYANRFMRNSRMDFLISNDWTTKFVTPATRNGTGVRIVTSFEQQLVDGFCGELNLNYTTFAALTVAGDIHTQIGKLRGIGSSVVTDRNNIDMSQTGGTRIDDIVRTVNADASSTPQFLPVGTTGTVALGSATAVWKEGFFAALKLSGLPVYANEAAAVVGGLTQNTVYQTATGELRIKL